MQPRPRKPGRCRRATGTRRSCRCRCRPAPGSPQSPRASRADLRRGRRAPVHPGGRRLPGQDRADAHCSGETAAASWRPVRRCGRSRRGSGRCQCRPRLISCSCGSPCSYGARRSVRGRAGQRARRATGAMSAAGCRRGRRGPSSPGAVLAGLAPDRASWARFGRSWCCRGVMVASCAGGFHGRAGWRALSGRCICDVLPAPRVGIAAGRSRGLHPADIRAVWPARSGLAARRPGLSPRSRGFAGEFRFSPQSQSRAFRPRDGLYGHRKAPTCSSIASMHRLGAIRPTQKLVSVIAPRNRPSA
jgi:hypothetical protein